MAFVEICPVSALAPGECKKVENGATPVAVFNVAGEFHAVDDTCTHGEWSLSEGYIEGATVECPLHSGKFCLLTGEVLAAPAYKPLRIYPVKIVNDIVFVDVAGGYFAADTSGHCTKGGKHGLA